MLPRGAQSESGSSHHCSCNRAASNRKPWLGQETHAHQLLQEASTPKGAEMMTREIVGVIAIGIASVTEEIMAG